jgi:hypothetical protein
MPLAAAAAAAAALLLCQVLIKIFNLNRHKTAVWRPMHSAGICMRLAALHYYK